MRYIFTLVLVVSSILAFSQSGRQHRPLYQIGNRFHNGGWHFAPGITRTFPADAQRSDQRLMNIDGQPSTVYTGDFEAAGRLGLYLEVGKQYFFNEPLLFHYIDFGLHFKQLRGAERFTGEIAAEGSMLAVENNGTFNDGFLGLYFNANHIVQLTDRSFLQFGIGLNADYRLLERRTFEGVAEPFIQEFADPFQGQLHLRAGFGIRPEMGILIIPTLETPILNIVPLYDGKSTLPYFSSRYRPVILSVRILFFGENRAEDCVGKGTEKRGDQLWGDDMQRHYGKRGGKKKKTKRPKR